jgi:DNA/RNA-binding domain of Phe-tRNA-synthetase-like protein
MISISSDLNKACPSLKCHIISGHVYNSINDHLINLLNETVDNSNFYKTNIEEIQATRIAYKACGKEPSRYRPSAEALRRRIRTGKGLYQINAIVDIINLISIQSGFSIGGYDHDAISGNITMRIGGQEDYNAVGRGNLNIQYLPCLYDEVGPFGSPTSDSARTKISLETQNLLMVFFDFNQSEKIDHYMDLSLHLLKKYCKFQAGN